MLSYCGCGLPGELLQDRFAIPSLHKPSTRVLTWLQTDPRLAGLGLRLWARVRVSVRATRQDIPGSKSTEAAILARVDYALNVADNASERVDDLLGRLGLEEAAAGRPWDARDIKQAQQAVAAALSSARAAQVAAHGGAARADKREEQRKREREPSTSTPPVTRGQTRQAKEAAEAAKQQAKQQKKGG